MDVESCLCCFSWLCWGILHNASFTELSYVAPCWIFAMLANAKTIFYTLNDRKAYQLIEDLIKLDDGARITHKLDSKNDLTADNLDTIDTRNSVIVNDIKAAESDFLKKVLKVLNIMYILLMTLYNAGPLVGTAVSYYRSGELRLFLPFLDVYPFDALTIQNWPYAYIHQFWSVFLVIFYTGSADCFLLICCTYIRIQFQLVKHDIEIIIPPEDKSFLYREDSRFRSKFQELVVRHQEIIGLSKTLRDIYSKSILVNVLTSSIVICLTGFNVTVIKELTLVLPSLGFLITNLLQVLCLCYFGNLLMSSSEEVYSAVYSSKWYMADKEITRKLLFILARAQMPCRLSASGFMDVNLRAFMRIISTSWSYFALLQTIYSQ